MHFFRAWQLIVLAVVATSAIGLILFSEKMRTNKVYINGKTFTMLRSDTPEQWKKGLGGRGSLGKYDGMVFLFPDNSQRPLVMRGMKFSLDVIWVSDSRVVDVKTLLEPEVEKEERDLTQYLPRTPAEIVIEVPAGFVQLNAIQIGDEVSVSL